MDSIHQILKKYWGYDSFRPLQEDIINSVLAGKDTLGLMPTGGGKSLTFQVPAMLKAGVCIVVTPLIALMKDQKDNLRERGIKATAVYSGMSRQEIIIALENCIYGDYKFLYVSPERLSTELFIAKLQAMKVSMLVVDESHCISQWGYDFRPAYLKIAEIRQLLPQVPVLALTATATPEVVSDIQQRLLFPQENVFKKSFARPNLSYVVRKTDDKQGTLLTMLNKVPGTAIVYVRSRKKTKEIAEYLLKNDIQADYYHAGLSAEVKEKKQDAWKKDACRVIVSTNAFGMGIDKADVRLVVHTDLPNSPEEYFQEAGRAGRDELRAYAVCLYSNSDKAKLRKRVTDSFPERDFIKNVYQSLGNYFSIAEGAGFEAVFDFDLYRFCSAYKLPMIPVHHALQLLEQAGYIVYEEDADSLSRVYFTVTRDDLYKLKQYDQKTNILIHALLRSYTGLFADYVFIREEQLMQRTGLTREEIYERMLNLSKSNVLSYIPAKKGSLIIYTRSREDIRYVSIPKTVYEERRDRYSRRIESMIEYAESQDCCRTKILLKYFGEKSASDCGTCDICVAKKRDRLDASTFRIISSQICNRLRQSPCSTEELMESLDFEQESVKKALRFMLDEGEIKEEKQMLIINKD